MALDVIALAVANKYTADTVAGAGAVAGKPCQIQSITDITGGHRVTFLWVDNNDEEHTTYMDVMDGAQGGMATDGSNSDETVSLTENLKVGTNKGSLTVGSRNNADIGRLSVTYGLGCEASNFYTLAGGSRSKATGDFSVSLGNQSVASASSAVSIGNHATASGNGSFSFGNYATASGVSSFAAGLYSSAGYDYQFVFGSRNDNKEETCFEIGNGGYNSETQEFYNQNAFEVYKDGSYVSQDNGVSKWKISFDSTTNKWGLTDGNGDFHAFTFE